MIKKFLIGTFAVAALAFALTVSAAYDFGTTTLRVGSSGAAVMTLQTLVGATADGAFGPMTKAKVMVWQAANGLTADGVFGPMSKAKANMVAGPVQGACPTGYVATTPSAPLFASCVAATPAQGSCPAGYVAITPAAPTFAACQATAVTPVTPVVTGGAGDISAVEVLSSVSGEKVGEGDTDHKVFAYTVEADNGSDLNLSSVKLNLERTTGSGSSKINRYASSVSVWMGSTKIGSAMVSDFSEASGVYSKSIALTGAVVKADQKVTFYVAIDALSNIDSTDLASNTWTVTLESTRFTDGTGAILTNTTSSILKTFQFASLATANDVELKVNLATSNPKAATVKVSTTTDTTNVELLKFTMKAQGSKMFIDQIPVLFTTTESTIANVTSNVILKIGGNTYNETITTGATTATVLFNDLNLTLEEGNTLEGIVLADLNDIETTTFDEGITLKAEITSALVVATSSDYIDVEDVNQDQLVTGDRTGSANGEAMTFRSTGVNTVMGTVTYDKTVNTSGDITSVTYTIPVSVTSFGNTLYMGQSAQLNATATASNAFAYVFQNSSAPTVADIAASVSTTFASSDAVIETNGFRLDDGQTKHFTITVNLMTPTTAANSYRVSLAEIRTFTEAALSTGTSSALTPVEAFRTDYKLITS